MALTIALRVDGTPVLVVGGGPVAERKVAVLLREGARVRVVSPAVTPGLRARAESGAIHLEERPYATGDQAGAQLVVTCTGIPEVDGAVAAEASQNGRLVSVSGEPDLGNVSFMAEVRRGPVRVAIATGGASPALAARLRREIEQAVGPEYGLLAELLGQARQRLQGAPHLLQAERAALFEAIVEGPALALLAAGRVDEVRNLLAEAVARILEPGAEG